MTQNIIHEKQFFKVLNKELNWIACCKQQQKWNRYWFFNQFALINWVNLRCKNLFYLIENKSHHILEFAFLISIEDFYEWSVWLCDINLWISIQWTAHKNDTNLQMINQCKAKMQIHYFELEKYARVLFMTISCTFKLDWNCMNR